MTRKVFSKGQLVELIHDVSPWENALGIVLEDYPKGKKQEHSSLDTLVHVFYADGKEVWTPFVFLEKVEE